MNPLITFQPLIKATKLLNIMPLQQALEDIKTGVYATQINNLQTLAGNEYTKAKDKLPAYIFQGTFKESNIKGFLESSDLVIIDIDKFKEGLGLDEVRNHLQTMPWVRALWVSPSGKGLKGLVKVKAGTIKGDPDFKAAMKSIAAGLYAMGIILDTSGKDIVRRCFVSYDPDLYDNPEATNWDTTIEPAQEYKEADPFTTEETQAANAHFRLIWAALKEKGLLKGGNSTHKIMCNCIDAGLHSDGNVGGAFYQTPCQQFPKGGFRCSHTHYSNSDAKSKREYNTRFHDYLGIKEFDRESCGVIKAQGESVIWVKVSPKGAVSLLGESVVADLLAEELANQLRYSPKSGEWQLFDSKQWIPSLLMEHERLINDTLREKIHPLKSDGFSNRYVKGVMDQMKTSIGWQSGEDDPHTLPFLNGQLDLRSKIITATTPRNAQTWCLPYLYDSENTNDSAIMEWLNQIFSNNPDVVNYALAWLRVILMGEGWKYQQFLHLMGEGGNGKSTFEALIGQMIGQNNSITSTLHDIEYHRFVLAEFRGKKMITIGDVSEYTSSVDNMKRLTGGDQIRAERKGVQSTPSFRFEGTVVLSSNTHINTSDRSEGLNRRRAMIAFPVKLSDSQKIDWRTNNRDVMVFSQIPALINRLLAMPQADIEYLLTNPPQPSKALIDEAILRANKVLEWYSEMITIDMDNAKGTQIGVAARLLLDGEVRYANEGERLYPSYCRYANTHGHAKTFTLETFKDEVVRQVCKDTNLTADQVTHKPHNASFIRYVTLQNLPDM